MTAATQLQPHVEFRHHLPANAQRSLRMTQAVVALVHAAVRNHGWTPKALAVECGRDLADVVNAGARVEERLRKAATHPPTNRPATAAKRPLCGRCEDGWQVHPATRLPVERCACQTTQQGRTE